MNKPENPREEYYREAQRWSADREQLLASSRRTAWIVAAVAAAVALFEAIALIALTPLKSTVPYTLLVDRQTGSVEVLKPLERKLIAPDAALTRSFLVQYVIARESFDIDSLRSDYQKVARWSAGDERSRYIAAMRASNPSSPLAMLPRKALVDVQVRSLSSLDADTALVRFSTARIDLAARGQPPQLWAAVITYRFSQTAMSVADRLDNPLGFQVVRYRRDAEIWPEPSSAPTERRPDGRAMPDTDP